MTPRVTLEDVAAMSGVSVSAASRALNGRDGVRDEVRERVRTVAAGLGYRPNRAAKNLAGGRTALIALLLGPTDLAKDPYAGSLLHAISTAADAAGEGLILINDSPNPRIAVQDLQRDGLVEGVIISIVALGERWVEDLLGANIPTVLVGAHPRRSDVHVVDVENTESSAAIVGHLFDQGLTRIATMTGPLHRVDAQDRLAGYHVAHVRRGRKVDESLVFESDFTRDGAYLLADRVLATEPEAVFCGNDQMAVALHRRATELGISIPDDLALCGFDGNREFFLPDLTTVCQPYSELAATAVRTLTDLIHGTQPRMLQLIEPKIFWGSTTPETLPPEKRTCELRTRGNPKIELVGGLP